MKKMIENILTKIQKLCGSKNIEYHEIDNNRHRIAVKEKDYTTNYLFSVPIRQARSLELVNLHWKRKKDTWITQGTLQDSIIQVQSDAIILSRPKRTFKLFFQESESFKEENGWLNSPRMHIKPTPNGVMVLYQVKAEDSAKFCLMPDYYDYEISKSHHYLSLMSTKFKPEITVSCLYFRGKDNEFSPLELKFQKEDANQFIFEFQKSVQVEGEIGFEINLYEEKLFQDTPVIEKRSKDNNAFCSTYFLGHTPNLGEQRIYSKLMLHNLQDFLHQRIQSIKLHIPKIAQSSNIEAYQMHERFCSFGSTWENKKTSGSICIPISYTEDYVIIDLTDYMVENGQLQPRFGMLLKVPQEETGFCLLSTGDSCAYPIFLEIKCVR